MRTKYIAYYKENRTFTLITEELNSNAYSKGFDKLVKPMRGKRLLEMANALS